MFGFIEVESASDKACERVLEQISTLRYAHSPQCFFFTLSFIARLLLVQCSRIEPVANSTELVRRNRESELIVIGSSSTSELFHIAALFLASSKGFCAD